MRRRPWRIAAIVALLLVFIGLLLIIDASPTLPPQDAPTGAQVQAGRDALKRVREAFRAPPPTTTIRFSDADVRGIAALVGNAFRVQRVAARIDGDRVKAGASLSLPAGLWLNVSGATVAGGPGFPALDVRVGDLPIPRWLTRAALGALRSVLVGRGATVPPLDTVVRSLTVSGVEAALVVQSPLENSGLIRQVVGLGGQPVEAAAVVKIYCRLVAQQSEHPEIEFAAQMRRAMQIGAPASAGDALAANRTALVALAMLTVGTRVGDLAGTAAVDADRACGFTPPGFLLAGRPDLAKHWSLSAAFAATVGGNITRAMGEWKELSDSLPGGTGFSFVDLTADRAGRRIGAAASSPGKAQNFRTALASATSDTLLPIEAGVLREGMDNSEFIRVYGNIDSRDFDVAVGQIDRLLDRDPLLRAAR